MKKWLLSLMTVGVCLQSGCIFFGDDDSKDPPTTNNSNNTKKDMSGDMANGDMSDDMPGDETPDIVTPDMMECLAEELPPDSLCCPGSADPVSVRSDVNNCGGCGIACNEGESCMEGKCTCEKGANPIVVAKDLSADSIVTVLPFWGADRVKTEAVDPAMFKGFEDVFKSNPSLLHYAVLHRKPNDIRINLIGLDAYGNTIDDAKGNFPLFTSSNRTIQDVEYWVGLDSITMFVHFRQQTKPRSELRLYTLVRGENNTFTLPEPNGIPFGGENDNGIVEDVLAMGTLASFEEFAIGAIVKDETKYFLVGGITVERPGSTPQEFDLPEVELTAAQIPQVGTKLNFAYDRLSQQLIVTWWSPSIAMPMPGARNGRFYAMIYKTDANGITKLTPAPIWLNDVQATDDRRDIPYAVPLGVNRGQRWQVFQLKKQASATNVQVVSVNPNPNDGDPAADNAMSIDMPIPTVAFSPGAAFHYNQGNIYRELTWVRNDAEATRGSITFAPVLEEGVKAQPISASKDYLSVAQGFGLPGTMGYVGLYHPENAGDKAAEIHFFMTQRGDLVCEPGVEATPQNP